MQFHCIGISHNIWQWNINKCCMKHLTCCLCSVQGKCVRHSIVHSAAVSTVRHVAMCWIGYWPRWHKWQETLQAPTAILHMASIEIALYTSKFKKISKSKFQKNKLFYIMIMRNFYFLSSWLRWVLNSSSPGLLKNGQKFFCYDPEPEKITKSKCRQFYGTPCILLTFLWIFLEFLPLWIILSSTLPVFRVPECWPLSN